MCAQGKRLLTVAGRLAGQQMVCSPSLSPSSPLSTPQFVHLSQQLKENFPGKKNAKVQDSLKSSCEYSIDRKEQTTPHAPHIERQPRPSASPSKVARKCAYKNTSKVAVADKVFCKTQGAVQAASGLDLLGRNANFQNHPGMAALRLV